MFSVVSTTLFFSRSGFPFFLNPSLTKLQVTDSFCCDASEARIMVRLSILENPQWSSPNFSCGDSFFLWMEFCADKPTSASSYFDTENDEVHILFTSVFGLVVGGPFCLHQHKLHLHCTHAGPDGGGVSSCECTHVYVWERAECAAWWCWCEDVRVDLLMRVWEM